MEVPWNIAVIEDNYRNELFIYSTLSSRLTSLSLKPTMIVEDVLLRYIVLMVSGLEAGTKERDLGTLENPGPIPGGLIPHLRRRERRPVRCG